MRAGLLWANGLILLGIAWMVAFGPNLRATQLVPRKVSPMLGDVPSLEANASLDPTVSNVRALAAAYLDRDQPGLASAVIAKAPAEVRMRPEVLQLHARALFHRGQAREALAVAEQAHSSCVQEDCPAWLQATTFRQFAFLKQVVDAGIEDPWQNPAATRVAYEKSTREVRLVAVR